MAGAKQIVCITGTLWTGDAHAPRKQLVEAGFLRPMWFTTYREITDAQYRRISQSLFHLALSRHEVLVHTEYGGGHMGILREDFEDALERSRRGVLVVCPPDVAAQLARSFPEAILFALRCVGMKLAQDLVVAGLSHRVHAIDVESWQPGAWDRAYAEMVEVIERA